LYIISSRSCRRSLLSERVRDAVEHELGREGHKDHAHQSFDGHDNEWIA
jgi:hypothetical protein